MNNIYNSPQKDKLEIQDDAAFFLREISRWTKFLSIVGFVFLGMMAFCTLGTGVFIDGTNRYSEIRMLNPHYPESFPWLYAIIYVFVLIAYFFPFYFLYKFSTRVKRALVENDSFVLTESFRFLKNHYLIIGTLALIGLIFFVVMFGCMLAMLFQYYS